MSGKKQRIIAVITGKKQVKIAQNQNFLPLCLATHPVIIGKAK